MPPNDVTFTPTDLARHPREVMDAARAYAGATIRDKDGTSFVLWSRARGTRAEYLSATYANASTILLDLHRGRPADPLRYGRLGWAASLSDDAREEFVDELLETLARFDVLGVDKTEDLLYAWQETAKIYADPDLRDELQQPLPAPVHDVEL